MTKDGRPSRIKDIRLFKETWVKSDEHTALAFARRLAWWLNGEGFSIGHTPALYVYYSSDLPAGTVEAKPPRFTPDDWWFREVTVGVPPGVPGETAVEAAERGTRHRSEGPEAGRRRDDRPGGRHRHHRRG